MAFYAPGILEKIEKIEIFSKNSGKNHAHIWYAPLCEISQRNFIVAALGKNNKFLTENEIPNFEFPVSNLSFLLRAATMTFCCEIFHDPEYHAHVRA